MGARQAREGWGRSRSAGKDARRRRVLKAGLASIGCMSVLVAVIFLVAEGGDEVRLSGTSRRHSHGPREAISLVAAGGPGVNAQPAEGTQGDTSGSELAGPQPGLAIHGRVLDRVGWPVHGVVVRARRLVIDPSSGALVPAGQPPLFAESDSQGGYAFTGLERGEYEVAAEPGSDHFARRSVFPAGTATAILAVESERTVRIEGRISSSAGEPLSRVTILTRGSATRSDGEGRYRVDLLLAAGIPIFSLSARRSGYESKEIRFRVEEVWDAEAVRMDLLLDPLAGPEAPERVDAGDERPARH